MKKQMILLCIFLFFFSNDISSNTTMNNKVCYVYSDSLHDTLMRNELMRDGIQKSKTFFINSENQEPFIIDRRANDIQREINKFHPDVIFTFGKEAFEHIGLKNKQKSFFFDIDEYDYRSLTTDDEYNGFLKKYNFETLKMFLEKNGFVTQELVFLFENSVHDEMLIQDIKSIFPEKKCTSNIIVSENDVYESLNNVKNKNALIFLINTDVKTNMTKLSENILALSICERNQLICSVGQNLSKDGIPISIFFRNKTQKNLVLIKDEIFTKKHSFQSSIVLNKKTISKFLNISGNLDLIDEIY